MYCCTACSVLLRFKACHSERTPRTVNNASVADLQPTYNFSILTHSNVPRNTQGVSIAFSTHCCNFSCRNYTMQLAYLTVIGYFSLEIPLTLAVSVDSSFFSSQKLPYILLTFWRRNYFFLNFGTPCI